MAFIAEQAKMAASIGDISIVLTDYLDDEVVDTVSYEVQVRQVDGSLFRLVEGDLAPHLTATQISALKALMVSVRTKTQKLIPG